MGTVSLIVAILGAVLGIVNTTFMIQGRRVRLRVTPCHAIFGWNDDPQIGLSIDVVNLSSMPVVVSMIGLRLDDGRQMITPRAITADRSGLPTTLAPRSSVKLLMRLRELDESGELPRVVDAFAETACGVRVYGSSPSLKQLVQEATERAA